MATSAARPSERRPRRIRLAILISSSTTSTRMRAMLPGSGEAKMRVSHGQGDPHVGPGGAVLGVRGAAVGCGHRRGDGQAEAGAAAAARLVGAREALERARQEGGREARPLV